MRRNTVNTMPDGCELQVPASIDTPAVTGYTTVMRILAGEFKGRKLLSPRAAGATRPITSSVKKSLFGMLGQSLEQATVVDLFCGTGTLGLEAISRGASRCSFAERDRIAVERLRRNIETVGVSGRSVIWRGDCFGGLAGRLSRIGEAVDIAFVDPPYAMARRWADDGDDWRRAVECIFVPLADHLSEDGTVVVRTDSAGAIPPVVGSLAIRRLRRYGDMVVSMLGRVCEGG